MVLALPLLLGCGVWAAMLAMVVVAANAVWGKRLLTPDEKRLLAGGLADYGKRFRPKRRFAGPEKAWRRSGL